MSKTTVCMCITTFKTFLWHPLHDYNMKPTFYEGCEHTAASFPFSLWTCIKSLRVQLQETEGRLHLANWVGLNRHGKVWKDANQFFSDVCTAVFIIVVKLPNNVAPTTLCDLIKLRYSSFILRTGSSKGKFDHLWPKVVVH